MNLHFNPVQFAGRALRKAGNTLLKFTGTPGTWLDVGAHHGETTIGHALQNPGLTIYAFEPNMRALASLAGRVPNYIVIPVAVSETDGHAKFHVNACDEASSLLKMDESAKRSWIGGDVLVEATAVTVPTIRLDTFMGLMGIPGVDFLKIDTQGADLAVLRSAGARIRDIAKITVEVDITPKRLYQGSASKDEIAAFMRDAGFQMVSGVLQSYGQEENLTFARVGDSRDVPAVRVSTGAAVA